MNQPASIRGVEIFAAGEHRPGKEYTPAHLDEMARNFARSCRGGNASLRVPVVIGHGEDQKFLEDSGLPAAAWVSNVYRKGDKLLADFDHVPPEVMRLISGKRYRAVSSEVYDEPPKGVAGKGHMLRRVALLGGEQPEIKGLAEIPVPDGAGKFSERFASAPATRLKFTHAWRSPSRGSWHCFAEMPTMGRDELLQKIAQMGGNVDALANADEAALGEMLRMLEGQGEPDEDDGAGTPDPVPDATQPSEGGSQFEEGEEGEEGMEEKPAEGKGVGEGEEAWPEPADEADWERHREHAMKSRSRLKSYEEHVRKCGEKWGKKYDEAGGDAAVPGAPQTDAVDLYTQPMHKMKAEMHAEVQKARAEIRKFAEQSRNEARIDAALDRAGREGRVSAAQRAALREQLLGTDAATLRRYGEIQNGKQAQGTALDIALAEIARRPSLFAPILPDAPQGHESFVEGDDEAGKVKAKWESFSEKFRENYRDAFGGKGMPDVFAEQRKANPSLKADEYLKAGK